MAIQLLVEGTNPPDTPPMSPDAIKVDGDADDGGGDTDGNATHGSAGAGTGSSAGTGSGGNNDDDREPGDFGCEQPGNACNAPWAQQITA